MSKEIDERVVEMRFDNRNFEQNVSTTMSTLGKLKEKLAFKGGSKGLEDVGTAAKNCTTNMNPLCSAVDGVKLKFSALEVMGITALTNITNSITNTAKRVASAFTIDPIKTGFSEYETQINAIQTILANTSKQGTNLDQVNAALDELNRYADKTIYNFTEMTRNIGTFTAAGLDLKTSTEAIQGIANLAAVSGSTSQQASTAMYQLSQALSTGTIRLMDWNSVVNAGMGGKVFQDAIIETAKGFDGVDQSIISAYESGKSFRELLDVKDYGNWFSSDLLAQTLQKFTKTGAVEYLAKMSGQSRESIQELQKLGDSTGFTSEEFKNLAKSLSNGDDALAETMSGVLSMASTAEDAATKVKTFSQLFDTLKEAAQSGWTESWETIVGDFGEAKELLTEMSDTLGGIIQKSSDSRNEVLLGGLASGWKQLLKQGVSDSEGYEKMIKEVALEHGVALDDMIKDNVDFQDALGMTLSDGRLTSETLTDALARLTEKTQGLSEEQMVEAGYTSEQVSQLVEFNKKVQEGTISMDDFAKKMMRQSGRENLIEAMRNSLNGVLSVIGPVKEAFQEIFPPMTAEQLYHITEVIKDLSAHLVLSETNAKNLKRTFKGVFAVFDILKQAITAVVKAILPMTSGVGDLAGEILGVTGDMGDWLVSIDEWIKKSDVFNTIAQTVFGVIKDGLTVIGDVLSAVKLKVESVVGAIKAKFDGGGFELFHTILERIYTRIGMVNDSVSDMKSGVTIAIEAMGAALVNSKFYQFFQALWSGVKIVGTGIAKAFGDIIGGITDSLKNADFNAFVDIVNAFLSGGILAAILRFMKKMGDVAKNGADFVGGLKDIKDAVCDTFGAIQTRLKAGALMKIATAIALLTASVFVLSMIDSAKLAASLTALAGLFTELMVSMGIMNKIGPKSKKAGANVTLMIGMSVAVLILASAMKKLADLEWNGIAKGLVGITVMLGALVGVCVALSKWGGKIKTGIASLIAMSLAVKILAGVCTQLAQLSWGELAKGLTSVGVLLAELAAFMAVAKFGKMGVNTGLGLLILAEAINVLAGSVKTFGEMNTDSLIQGLIALGVVLTELAIFTTIASGSKGMITTATGMVILGAAIQILSDAVGDLGSLDTETLFKGLLSMAIALGEVVLALKLIPKDAIITATGMVILGAALEIIANVITKLGNLSMDQIVKGLSTMGIALGLLALALNAMNGTLKGSAALLIAAGALAIIAPVLSILGAMSWTAIAKGLIALAGAFAVVGIAGALLSPIIPAILALAGSMALIGLGIAATGAGLLLAGAGLSAIAIGLTALATSMAASCTAIVAGLTVIILGIAGLIPAVLTKLGEGIIAFCQVLIDSAPVICQAFVTIVTSVIEALATCIPLVVETIFQLLTSVLTTLAEYTPTIVQAVFDVLIACLQGIANNISMVVQAGIDIIIGFLDGIAQKIPDVIQAGFDLLISFIDGITNAINKNTPRLVTSMQNLFIALLKAALTVLGGGIELLKKAGTAIMESGLVKGIKDKVGGVGDSISKGIDDAKKAVEATFSGWVEVGANIIKGIKQGIDDFRQEVVDTAGSIASGAIDKVKNVLGIHSPSRAFAEIGMFSDKGFAKGLLQYASVVQNASQDVAQTALDEMSDSISRINDYVNSGMDATPIIRPVLDLSNVENGTARLSSMFNRNQAVSIGASLQARSAESVGNQNGQTEQSSLGNTFQFTQNNYSPKALSRSDIYRQTNNQFSAFERMVHA